MSFKQIFFFAFLMGCCLSTSVHAQEEPPEILNLVANEWEPYTGANVLNQGLATDIVATALRRAGYDVDVRIVPWTRALKGVETGTYHGLIAAWYSKEREEKMVFSDHYVTNDLVLFTQKGADIKYETLADLEEYTIGIVRDYAYGEEFDKSTTLKKKAALDLRTNIVRLSKGLVQLYPEDRFVMKHVLNTSYPEYKSAFGFLPKPLSQQTLHMTISRKVPGHEKIVADFNREYAGMIKEGLLQRMIDKHDLSF